MNISTVSTKYQATIPEEIRKVLSVNVGDKLLYTNPDPRGKKVVIEIISTKNVVDELYGSLKSKVPYTPMRKARKAIGPFLAKELGLTK